MFLWSCVAYVATSQDTTAQLVAGKRLLLFEDKSGVATTVPCHTVPWAVCYWASAHLKLLTLIWAVQVTIQATQRCELVLLNAWLGMLWKKGSKPQISTIICTFVIVCLLTYLSCLSTCSANICLSVCPSVRPSIYPIYPILSSYPILSCPVLSYPTLSYPILSIYPIYPSYLSVLSIYPIYLSYLSILSIYLSTYQSWLSTYLRTDLSIYLSFYLSISLSHLSI